MDGVTMLRVTPSVTWTKFIYIYIYIYKDEQTHTLDSDFNAILVFINPKEHKISVGLKKWTHQHIILWF